MDLLGNKGTEPVIELLTSSAENRVSRALDWLIGRELQLDYPTSWIFDSDDGALISSLQKLGLDVSVAGLLLNALATVLVRCSHQSELELGYAPELNFGQGEQDNKLAFYRIKFQDHIHHPISDLGARIDHLLASNVSSYLCSDSSVEPDCCLIEIGSDNDVDLEELKQAFEQRKGVIWLLLDHGNETGKGSRLKWLCAGQVSEKAIPKFQGYMRHLVDAAFRLPRVALSGLTMLGEQEIAQQLVFSKGETYRNPAQALFMQIEQHALNQPGAIAVVCGSNQLSYQQLNQRTNQLAHALLARSVEPGDRIAVHITPSENILVALLAIHKTGAIYVPLDPEFPAARIEAILEEISPSVILCDETVDHIPPLFAGKCANICELIDLAVSRANPNISVLTDFISHIYFTSGTTGRPKGVVATHKNLIHYISAGLNRYQISQNDCFIAAARFTFSISMFELMTALVAGGRVNVLRRAQVLDLSQLCRAIEASTVFHFGPSLLKQLLPYIEDNYASFKSFDRLRHVSSGGDMVPPEILEKLKKIFRKAEVFVIYGSSEISVMGCTFEVSRDKEITRTRVGRPHQNVSVRVLDPEGNMVPIGVTGQLYFAGDGLVQGYLNLPALTKEKFKMIDGQRFYAIGDVGRLDDKGDIELLGREDFQIQLRGIRIELAEVDSYLRQLPGVRDAVSVAKTLGSVNSHEKSIVAYVVAKPSEYLDVVDMKADLARWVPDYMIPAAFVQLDSLPVNHNMKIDRNMLPEPSRQNLLESRRAPIRATKTLNQLIRMFNRLCVSNITLDDAGLDFYALGIDSITLMQLRLACNTQFKRSFPLKLLQQERTTILSLADYLEQENSTLGQDDDAEIEIIKVLDRKQAIRASFAQQRLWFLDRLLGENNLYNIPWAIRLKGRLDSAILTKSLNVIVARQESLRTYFVDREGTPFQCIEESLVLNLEQIDLSELAVEKLDQEEQRILELEASRVFDLKRPPLVRAVLLKRSEQEHVLSVTMHHIISDGWSINIFELELANIYTAFLSKKPATLANLPVQYADYSAWQNDRPTNAVLNSQLDYWKQQLADLAVLDLPSDHVRPKQLTYQGAQENINFPAALTRRIKQFSQEQGVSLFMTLLAAFQVLLHRYSGQGDIAVGSPIAGRNTEGIEGLIGFFINTLVLRGDTSGNPRFIEYLQQVRQTCIEAYAHQDISFESLVSELQPRRELNRQPLFQVMLNLLPAAEDKLQMPGLNVENVPVALNAAKYDISVSLQESVKGLSGFIEYSTDLYEPDTIQRLVGHFQTILEAIVEHSERRIGELPMLTAREQQQLLYEWNDTAMNVPEAQTIVDRFERQVAKTPENLALVFGQQRLSYQAFNQQANQLAHHLLSLSNISANPLTAIVVDRSIEMAIALMAVWKAGRAYVPIDPSYPPERIHQMLEDSETPLLLSQSTLKAHVALKHDCKEVYIDTLDVSQLSKHNPQLKVVPTDLAYVIYTSGSTGKPKGVMIEHKGVISLATHLKQVYKIDANSRVLQFASLSFDVATWDFLKSVCNGGILHLVTKEQIHSELQNVLQKQSITHATLPPSVANLLSNEDLPKLKYLTVAGEECSPATISKWAQTGRHVINAYGPTEVTVCTSLIECAPDGKKPSIGRPLANTRLYILNAQDQVQACNVPGELCISGIGLARAYLNRPELSAEKFVEVELLGKRERIYRTGDQARWLSNGTIDFLGRNDNQVKLRGFRIELGEIEAVLEQITDVNDALVVVREENTCDKALLAYIVHPTHAQPSSNALRSFLKNKLPDYMVPSAFVLLEKFPLTSSGKIDRAALPLPDRTNFESNQQYCAPRSITEEKLVSIWQSILGIERIGINDDFFELGGHSLLAVQLMAQIEKRFNQSITLAVIFGSPTVARIAEALSSGQNQGHSDLPVLLESPPSDSAKNIDRPILFCIYGVYLYHDLAKQLKNDASVYGVYIQEELELIKSQEIGEVASLDVSKIAEQYIRKIRRIQEHGPYNLAGASFGGIVAYEIAQQLKADGECVNVLALFDSMAPCGLSWSLPLFTFDKMQKIKAGGVATILEMMRKLSHKNLARRKPNANKLVKDDIRDLARRTAISTFSPNVYPGKISLFRVDDEDQWAGYKVDPYYGWRALGAGGVDIIRIPSHHLGILKAPHVNQIADYLREHF